jgi:hypothetical protein
VGEVPILLNPTIDDPRQHLEFKVVVALQGKSESVASPKTRQDGTLDVRGEGTIRVVGLNRPKLTRGRMMRIKSMRLALRSIEKEWERYRYAVAPEEKASVLAKIKAETKEVWGEFLEWRAPFSAACRTDYRRWTAEIMQLIAANQGGQRMHASG